YLKPSKQLSFKTLSFIATFIHTINMPLFKRSSKNQSSSAASTPAQTPRVSMQEDERPIQPTDKTTRDQALDKVMQNILSSAAARAYVR
ncbi:hypothetical protein BGX27_000481, partial [Mortierella sp. AM989]